MPAYNAEKYIEESINSVINQTYKHWELLIIDDGSTDGTQAIINTKIIQDNRIKYYYQENCKQGKARNLGIKKSSGFYLAFIDADDLWIAEKLDIQIQIIQNENLDLIFSQGYLINLDKSIVNFDVKVKYWNKYVDTDLFIMQNQIPILSVLAKKSAVLESGLFSEKTTIQNTEDYHLWIKLLVNGYKILSIVERLFYYRLNENQCTFNNQNLVVQTTYLFEDLISNNFLKSNDKVISRRIKWFAYSYPNIDSYCCSLIIICPAKRFFWNSVKALNFLLPELYLRKILFKLL